MRRVLAASLSVLVLAWWPSPTVAHTDLVSVSPGDGARVDDWPPKVVLVFTEPVDLSLSALSVAVNGTEGERIPLGRGDDDSEAVGDLRSLEPDASGSPSRVRVSYRVTSADGHPIAGSSTFTVDPVRNDSQGGAPPSGADPTASTPEVPDASASQSGVEVWLVGGVLALVLVSAVTSVRRLRATASQVEQVRR